MSRTCQLRGALLALVLVGSLSAQPPDGAQPLPSLAERMAHHRVPGVSIAVVDSGRIVWAHGFGVRAVGTNDSVTSRTLFQAASISKPIAATGMLRLVERGILALDEDVNVYLKMWRVPTSVYAVTQRVTLRRLATHSAGLTVHGFPGYAVETALPTIAQVLNGAAPANTGPVTLDTIPGARFRYSGGGTTVMQLVMTDVTGRPFPQLMEELVLAPIGMRRSTYEQPLQFAGDTDVAHGHFRDGTAIAGGWHVYPEMAAAGLWTTPREIMQWAMEIAAARAGTSTSLLSKSMSGEMLTDHLGSRGLGPSLGGAGRAFRFFHGGDNAGFKAEFVYFPEVGKGAAVMTNGDGGTGLILELWSAIGAKYHWPEYPGPKVLSLPRVRN